MLTSVRDDRPDPLGGAGTRIVSGLIADIDPTAEVRGDLWYGAPGRIGIASRMMRDAHVRRGWASVASPIRRATWDVEQVSDDPRDAEIAKFCRWNLFRRLDFDRFLRDTLLYGRDGFSVHEVTDDIVPLPKGMFPLHPGGGRGLVITGFHQRPSWTVKKWIQSKADPSKLDGIEQWIIGSDAEKPRFQPISADRLLRFSWEQEGANFAGMAALRSCYGPWLIKLTLLVLLAIRHERQGVGVPTLTLPEGAGEDTVEKAELILAEMRAHEKGYLCLPFGYTFAFTSGGESTGIQDTIEQCNRDIAFNFGSGFMLLGLTGQGPGSHALSQTQLGQHEVEVELHAGFVGTTLTLGSDGLSPLGRLTAANYGEDAPVPQVVVLDLPTRDWSKIFPVVKELKSEGIITADDRLEGFARRAMKLPLRDKATSRMPPATPAPMPQEASA